MKLSLSKSTSFGPGFAPRRPRWREPGTTRAEPTSRSSVTNPKRTHLQRPPRPRTPRKPSPCAENWPHSPPRIPAPRKKSQSSRKKYVSATPSSYNKPQSPMHGSRNSHRSSTDRGPTRNASRRVCRSPETPRPRLPPASKRLQIKRKCYVSSARTSVSLFLYSYGQLN